MCKVLLLEVFFLVCFYQTLSIYVTDFPYENNNISLVFLYAAQLCIS